MPRTQPLRYLVYAENPLRMPSGKKIIGDELFPWLRRSTWGSLSLSLSFFISHILYGHPPPHCAHVYIYTAYVVASGTGENDPNSPAKSLLKELGEI